jgi:putative ABC transport system ATP-binding protein
MNLSDLQGLSITGLRKRFHTGGADEVLALDAVDLRVARGECVTIIGTNGSGKSTLLSAIAGSVRCETGHIHLEGRDLTALAEHERARWIGRVFQNPFQGTAGSMSIAENLALAARRGQSRGLRLALDAQLRAQIRERIADLGMSLEDRLEAPLGTLSGGQRQALSLLMATWTRPDLFLLDEHTSALDPRSAAQIMELTRWTIAATDSLNAITTLMVTHSMQQASQAGGRIVLMHRGRIQREWASGASTDELLAAFDELRRAEEALPAV